MKYYSKNKVRFDLDFRKYEHEVIRLSKYCIPIALLLHLPV